MKINEEYVIVCSMDMRELVNKLYDKYKNEITMEEIEYYRRNLKPSRYHQLFIEIFFFGYTSSSQEFALLRNLDWFKLLLIMKKEIIRRMNIDPRNLIDSPLPMLLTSNIEEIPVGDKVYLKDLKYLKDHEDYKLLVDKYYNTIVAINEDIVKKFLINIINSKFTFVLYEDQSLLGEQITMNKRELIDHLLNFLIVSNTNIDLEGKVRLGNDMY